jgi:membrane protein implicated in regulation of membrane protease activity
METIVALGAWNWMILAAVLFVLELTAPGIFLMWFGVAAAVTGLIVFRYDIGWQWQLIWFCGLSLASVLLAIPVTLLLANLIAAGPGWTAARVPAATVLRGE